MTVSVVPTWVQTPGNGAATVYNFPFLITSTTDLVVGFIVGGLYIPQTAGYTVSFTPGIQGGQVTFGSPPPVGTTVDTRSLLPQTQPTNFANLGAYYPENATNASDRGTRLSSDMYRLTYQFGIHGPDTEGTPWPALPPPAQRLGMGLVFDTVTGLPGVGVLLSTPLTQSGFNGFLGGSNAGALFFPVTQYEINAGAFIANPFVASGNPLRYGINAAPGSADMAPAVNTAVASLLGTVTNPGPGGELIIDTSGGPYLLNSPINCTWAGSGGAPPVCVRFSSGGHNSDNPRNNGNGVVLNHNSIGFDCTGNDTISFIDVSIATVIPETGPPPNIPTIGILFARNTTRATLINRVTRPRIVGYFSIANIYDYSAENMALEGLYLTNYGAAGAGNCCIAFTSNNYAGVTSIVPGLIMGGGVPGPTSAYSMSAISTFYAQYTMYAPNATSDCVHLDGVFQWQHFGGWCYNPGGRSGFYVDNTWTSSNAVTINGFSVDQSGAPGSVILFGAATTNKLHTGWNTCALRSNSVNFAISAVDANTTMDNWTCAQISENQSHGISFPGALQGSSTLLVGGNMLQFGTAAQGCLIVGRRSNITIPGGFNLARMLYNDASQAMGFGIPTGAATITAAANFNGATASPMLTSQVVALMLQLWLSEGRIAS